MKLSVANGSGLKILGALFINISGESPIGKVYQKKKLYYSGSRTWTTHYDRRKLYKTYEEANKENEQFLRDILYMHKDRRGSILSDDK